MNKEESQNIDIHKARVSLTVELSVLIEYFRTTFPPVFGDKDVIDYANILSGLKTT